MKSSELNENSVYLLETLETRTPDGTPQCENVKFIQKIGRASSDVQILPVHEAEKEPFPEVRDEDAFVEVEVVETGETKQVKAKFLSPLEN